MGAVAIDSNRLIFAATSTGATPKKMAGRDGDSSIVGTVPTLIIKAVVFQLRVLARRSCV
ncbi:MAG: isoaspartyl peptidase/L-asparaginase [Methanomassiliicoccales archaeon]|nr:isoaspartyl peptidase/L-asparaginase [Methanomassiliicoccales archaeon]